MHVSIQDHVMRVMSCLGHATQPCMSSHRHSDCIHVTTKDVPPTIKLLNLFCNTFAILRCQLVQNTLELVKDLLGLLLFLCQL